MSDARTLLFVCLHGAGMSRIAAAYFNREAPANWDAISAGVEPSATLSSTAASLPAGTGAEEFLDHSPPRPISDVPGAQHVIALRNPEIQYGTGAAEYWDLSNTAGMPLRDEIRQRVEALVESIDAPRSG